MAPSPSSPIPLTLPLGLLLTLTTLPSLTRAFTWNFQSTPQQCSNLTVAIQGTDGRPPYRLLILPFGPTPLANSVEVRKIVDVPFEAGAGSVGFLLRYPENSQFVAVIVAPKTVHPPLMDLHLALLLLLFYAPQHPLHTVHTLSLPLPPPSEHTSNCCNLLLRHAWLKVYVYAGVISGLSWITPSLASFCKRRSTAGLLISITGRRGQSSGFTGTGAGTAAQQREEDTRLRPFDQTRHDKTRQDMIRIASAAGEA
ncbi:hypothetical protein B0H34DRAFT_671522 [Crassisporium funariophilum]|nr:hypothetical protein B0H34DRAFT_671522 [Crassisporium funariophilum]